jgi:hypothetical protein
MLGRKISTPRDAKAGFVHTGYGRRNIKSLS